MSLDNYKPTSADRQYKREADLRNILDLTVEERDAVGYMASRLLQATFPYRDPNVPVYVGTNGKLEVTMTSAKGLPYGSYPRLIICWLTMAAQQNMAAYEPDNPERYRIGFGSNLAQFMRELGIETASYGKNGTATRFREQLIRLFRTSMSIEYHDDSDDTYETDEGTMLTVGETWKVYWSKNDVLMDSNQQALLESHVVLSRKFFELLTNSATPIDLDILKHIKGSPMAIDVYCWVTNRFSRLRAPTVVTVPQLMHQFGTKLDPDSAADRRTFNQQFKKALEKVREVWPEINATMMDRQKGLLLKPTAPSVLPKRRVHVT